MIRSILLRRRPRRVALALPFLSGGALTLSASLAWAEPPPAAPASITAVPLATPALPPPAGAPPWSVSPPQPEEPPPGLRGPRIGFTPGIGLGFAAFTGSVGFPSFVFTTAIQLEALVELDRWGFFLRGGFVSAGSSGRWVAPTIALGTQYRLVGDGEERWGLVVRAGAIYQRWNATPTAGNCDVFYFIPNSCQNYVESEAPTPGAPTPVIPSSITADSVGLLAAVRVDVPVEPIYVAFDAEVSAAADVDQSIPGAAITGQLVLTFALRDHPIRRKGPQTYGPRQRFGY